MAKQQPPIAFRASDDLEEALLSRNGQPPLGLTAQRDLERYYQLLAEELLQVSLTEAEASLIVDATNGAYWEAMTIRLLWAGVDDAIRLRHLDQHWEVDGGALVAKLRALTPGQAFAIADACERFWKRRPGEDASFADGLRDVGLLR